MVMGRDRQCKTLSAEILSEAEEARLSAVRMRRSIGMLAEARMKRAARSDRESFEALSRWYVARVPSGCEIETRRKLCASGIESWLPVQHKRRTGRRGLPAKVVEKAFWPGYVFVRLIPGADAWAGAIMAGDMIGWVGDGLDPAAIPTHEVESLQRCDKSGDFEREAKLIGIPLAGDTVEISEGILAGMSGVVRRFNDARQEVSVLVNLLGGKVAATIRLDDVIVCR